MPATCPVYPGAYGERLQKLMFCSRAGGDSDMPALTAVPARPNLPLRPPGLPTSLLQSCQPYTGSDRSHSITTARPHPRCPHFLECCWAWASPSHRRLCGPSVVLASLLRLRASGLEGKQADLKGRDAMRLKCRQQCRREAAMSKKSA